MLPYIGVADSWFLVFSACLLGVTTVRERSPVCKDATVALPNLPPEVSPGERSLLYPARGKRKHPDALWHSDERGTVERATAKSPDSRAVAFKSDWREEPLIYGVTPEVSFTGWCLD